MPLSLPESYIRIFDSVQYQPNRSIGFYEFDINERGKKRHIKSVTIGGTSSDPALAGKLYQLRFYERRLSDAETMALLGVSSLSTVITEDLDPTS